MKPEPKPHGMTFWLWIASGIAILYGEYPIAIWCFISTLYLSFDYWIAYFSWFLESKDQDVSL